MLQTLVPCILTLYGLKGSCKVADPSKRPSGHEANASSAAQPKAPRQSWQLGRQQDPGPENQERAQTESTHRSSTVAKACNGQQVFFIPCDRCYKPCKIKKSSLLLMGINFQLHGLSVTLGLLAGFLLCSVPPNGNFWEHYMHTSVL